MLHFETLPPGTLDILTALTRHPALEPFGLVGGTSLSLRFGHRISEDLDFFTTDSFDSDSLAAEISPGHVSEIRRSGPNILHISLDNVKVDFATHRYPRLEPVEILDGVRISSLPDVIAMKLSAIVNRGAKKDFYDADMLIARLGLAKLLEHHHAKFANHDPVIVLRSLAYFSDAELQKDPASLTGATWVEVKERISTAVKKML
jgi:hypothetical protein